MTHADVIAELHALIAALHRALASADRLAEVVRHARVSHDDQTAVDDALDAYASDRLDV